MVIKWLSLSAIESIYCTSRFHLIRLNNKIRFGQCNGKYFCNITLLFQFFVSYYFYLFSSIQYLRIKVLSVPRESRNPRKICFPALIKRALIILIPVHSIKAYFVINFQISNISNLLLISRIANTESAGSVEILWSWKEIFSFQEILKTLL